MKEKPETDAGINDGEIIRKIKNNDTEAFRQLYFRYYKMMIGFAWNRTGSTDTAKEHVQELFCRIWIKRSNLDPEKPIKPYLYKALNNIIINSNRLSFNKLQSLDNAGNERFSGKKEDQDLRIDVYDAVNKLPEKIKKVFLMSRLDKFSYQEIADIEELSIKTIEKRMSKALAILRKILLK